MNHTHVNALNTIILFFLLLSCSSESPSKLDLEIKELEDYETFVSFEDGKLSNPTNVRFKGDSLLYIYDAEKRQVISLDENGSIVNKYGGQGWGPGEFIRVNNIFIDDNYLYILDRVQFLIVRFKLNGDLDSSFDYGQRSYSMPPPKPTPSVPKPKNINNQPFVIGNGNLLLPVIKPKGNFNKLYKLVDWKGNYISGIGSIPENNSFVLNHDKYQTSVSNEELPAFYISNAFPLNDYTDTRTFYLIYTACHKIVKYDISGTKLWEKDIPKTPELDSIFTNFYKVSSRMNGRNRIELNTYMSGVSGPDGTIYLVLNKNNSLESSNRLWIHKFNTEGELIQRYKLISKDVNLVPIFNIDFESR